MPGARLPAGCGHLPHDGCGDALSEGDQVGGVVDAQLADRAPVSGALARDRLDIGFACAGAVEVPGQRPSREIDRLLGQAGLRLQRDPGQASQAGQRLLCRRSGSGRGRFFFGHRSSSMSSLATHVQLILRQ